jgi:glutathione S-transferase
MHSGFGALRSFCPMNIEAQLQETGARLWAEHADLRSDVQQLEELWTPLLSAASGPMLFGQFSIADAFFAPVCMRINSYGLPTWPRYAPMCSASPSCQPPRNGFRPRWPSRTFCSSKSPIASSAEAWLPRLRYLQAGSQPLPLQHE